MTVTRSDGTEHVGLVGIDQHQRRQVDDALNRTLDELARIIGSPHRAQNALLALLGERLISVQPDFDRNEDSLPVDFTIRRAQHG